MSISNFNNEGYFDPTAYGALSVVDKEERAKWKNYRLRYFTENLEEV